MTFWDEVYKLRQQGLIPRVWTRADLLPQFKSEYPHALISLPFWHAMSEDGAMVGYFVRAGLRPEAWSLGDGKFRLVIDPEDDAEIQQAELKRANAGAKTARSRFQSPLTPPPGDQRFWDAVAELRRRNAIPRVWNVDCLMPLMRDTYARKEIRAYVDSYSVTPDGMQSGYSVTLVNEPRVWRVGDGQYRLVSDPADDAATRQAERRRARVSAEQSISRQLANPDSGLLPEAHYTEDLWFEPMYIPLDEFKP